jgi:hypothetical protein
MVRACLVLALGAQKPEGTAFPSQLRWNVTFSSNLYEGADVRFLNRYRTYNALVRTLGYITWQHITQILKGYDDGVYHSGLLSFWTLDFRLPDDGQSPKTQYSPTYCRAYSVATIIRRGIGLATGFIGSHTVTVYTLYNSQQLSFFSSSEDFGSNSATNSYGVPCHYPLTKLSP